MRIVGCALLLLLTACRVDDGGRWAYNVPQAPAGTPVSGEVDLVAAGLPEWIGDIPVVIDEKAKRGLVLTCAIPADPGSAPLFDRATTISAVGSADSLCLKPDDATAAHCRWVAEMTARRQAIASCLAEALLMAEKWGDDLASNYDRTWKQLRDDFAAGIWLTNAADADADNDKHRATIASLIGSVQAAGSPLCFPKTAQQALVERQQELLNRLFWLAAEDLGEQRNIVSQLEVGIEAQVVASLPPLALRVRFTQAPRLVQGLRCGYGEGLP
ncbi:MAG: hypothetical protein H6707_05160 [Deltaproteobacteria bacterium]|nr:hypothetical protein [Deltaproteobacteria bacterium]